MDEAGAPIENVCVVIGPGGCQTFTTKTDERGYWTLKRRLAGCEDWEEFESTSIARPLFGGLANEDELHTEHEEEDTVPIGMSFRFFDSETRQWSIYWSDTKSFRLFPPTSGKFEEGRGEFFGDDYGYGLQHQFGWIV